MDRIINWPWHLCVCVCVCVCACAGGQACVRASRRRVCNQKINDGPNRLFSGLDPDVHGMDKQIYLFIFPTRDDLGDKSLANISKTYITLLRMLMMQSFA